MCRNVSETMLGALSPVKVRCRLSLGYASPAQPPTQFLLARTPGCTLHNQIASMRRTVPSGRTSQPAAQARCHWPRWALRSISNSQTRHALLPRNSSKRHGIHSVDRNWKRLRLPFICRIVFRRGILRALRSLNQSSLRPTETGLRPEPR